MNNSDIIFDAGKYCLIFGFMFFFLGMIIFSNGDRFQSTVNMIYIGFFFLCMGFVLSWIGINYKSWKFKRVFRKLLKITRHYGIQNTEKVSQQ